MNNVVDNGFEAAMYEYHKTQPEECYDVYSHTDHTQPDSMSEFAAHFFKQGVEFAKGYLKVELETCDHIGGVHRAIEGLK